MVSIVEHTANRKLLSSSLSDMLTASQSLYLGNLINPFHHVVDKIQIDAQSNMESSSEEKSLSILLMSFIRSSANLQGREERTR